MEEQQQQQSQQYCGCCRQSGLGPAYKLIIPQEPIGPSLERPTTTSKSRTTATTKAPTTVLFDPSVSLLCLVCYPLFVGPHLYLVLCTTLRCTGRAATAASHDEFTVAFATEWQSHRHRSKCASFHDKGRGRHHDIIWKRQQQQQQRSE